VRMAHIRIGWRKIAITLIAMTIGAESGAEQEDLIRRKAAV
jgi:hypothetical protein